MPDLSRQEMLDLVERHFAAEAAGDVDSTMATVCPNPLFEFFPLGYRLTCRENVAELYRRVLPSQARRTGLSTRKNIWFNNEGCVIETESRFKDGQGRDHSAANIVAFTFEDGLIKSERVFLDPVAAAMFDAALGPDFSGFLEPKELQEIGAVRDNTQA
jgi:ketosteroid isomerase-like protein